MRQLVLIDYSRFIESRGFIRLKDEKNYLDTITTTTTTTNTANTTMMMKTTTSNQRGNLNQHQQIQQQHNNSISAESQVQHFIKWISQDGFLYLTLHLDEVFIHVKLGYSARYRATSSSFLNEIVRFFRVKMTIIFKYTIFVLTRGFYEIL